MNPIFCSFAMMPVHRLIRVMLRAKEWGGGRCRKHALIINHYHISSRLFFLHAVSAVDLVAYFIITHGLLIARRQRGVQKRFRCFDELYRVRTSSRTPNTKGDVHYIFPKQLQCTCTFTCMR